MHCIQGAYIVQTGGEVYLINIRTAFNENAN